ncbi:DUF1878 family protein [Bacillus sp. Marseille-P3661]|uniref:DUF1878 family protein n=1 Tax=Bacillus sp. Marseille-P3661 TaxID=1936234 RepID=UPI000C83DEC3|nr:DUF1878 family protein [Bacillus sp. Marseille-P3661]
MELEERLKKVEYHQKLLLKMLRGSQFPVYEIVINKDLTEDEVDDIFKLCEELNCLYEQQKEEGFVHFIPLLTKFVGLLNHKISAEEMIDALIGQKLYLPLMMELRKSLNDVREEH